MEEEYKILKETLNSIKSPYGKGVVDTKDAAKIDKDSKDSKEEEKSLKRDKSVQDLKV